MSADAAYKAALLAVDVYKEEKIEEEMYADWIEEYQAYQDEWSLWSSIGKLGGAAFMAMWNPFGWGLAANVLVGLTAGGILGNVGHYLTHPSDREKLKPFDFGGKFDSGYEREAEKAMKQGEITGWDSFNLAFLDVVDFVKGGGLNPDLYGKIPETVAGAAGTPDPVTGITPAPASIADKVTGTFEPGDIRNLYDTTTNTWEDAVMTADGRWWVGDPMTGHEIGLQEGDLVSGWNYRNVMQPEDPKVYAEGELTDAWGTYEAGIPEAPINQWGSQPSAFGSGASQQTYKDYASMYQYLNLLYNTAQTADRDDDYYESLSEYT